MKKQESLSSNKTKKHFYVYYSYEQWGRGYIGRRECWCLPEEDVKYLGSFRDKTFKPTEKIILEKFDNIQDAMQAEVDLHEFYQVDKNPHFANRSRAKMNGFYYAASGESNPFYRGKFSDEVIEKIRNYQLSRGENHISKSPEFRQKMAERCKSENGPSKSLEAKKKMSESISRVLRALGDNHPSKSDKFKESIKRHYQINGHPWTNRKHTEETKKKISQASIGRNKGIKRSQETKDKVSDSKCKYVYTLISPRGEVFEVLNARKFCDENGLTDIGIYRVVNGKADNHKGWKASRRLRTEEDK